MRGKNRGFKDHLRYKKTNGGGGVDENIRGKSVLLPKLVSGLGFLRKREKKRGRGKEYPTGETIRTILKIRQRKKTTKSERKSIMCAQGKTCQKFFYVWG